MLRNHGLIQDHKEGRYGGIEGNAGGLQMADMKDVGTCIWSSVDF